MPPTALLLVQFVKKCPGKRQANLDESDSCNALCRGLKKPRIKLDKQIFDTLSSSLPSLGGTYWPYGFADSNNKNFTKLQYQRNASKVFMVYKFVDPQSTKWSLLLISTFYISSKGTCVAALRTKLWEHRNEKVRCGCCPPDMNYYCPSFGGRRPNTPFHTEWARQGSHSQQAFRSPNGFSFYWEGLKPDQLLPDSWYRYGR